MSECKHADFGTERPSDKRPVFDGKYVYRILWERANGPLPQGITLHHKCENAWCVNLNHLEPLTDSEHKAMHQAERNRARGFAANALPKRPPIRRREHSLGELKSGWLVSVLPNLFDRRQTSVPSEEGTAMSGQARMVGVAASDPHKNTANCGKANDRDRRRVKRTEKVTVMAAAKTEPRR